MSVLKANDNNNLFEKNRKNDSSIEFSLNQMKNSKLKCGPSI